MKLPPALRNLFGAASAQIPEEEERRETKGRRRTDHSLVPAQLKYVWAALVTVLVITSTVLGDGSRHKTTLDLVLRVLTGYPAQPADTEGSNR